MLCRGDGRLVIMTEWISHAVSGSSCAISAILSGVGTGLAAWPPATCAALAEATFRASMSTLKLLLPVPVQHVVMSIMPLWQFEQLWHLAQDEHGWLLLGSSTILQPVAELALFDRRSVHIDTCCFIHGHCRRPGKQRQRWIQKQCQSSQRR